MLRFWMILGGAALGAGWLLAALGIPAAWFLGPMAVAAGAACWPGKQAPLPDGIYTVAQAIIGGAASTALTPAALTVIVDYWLAIVLVIGALLLLSLISGLLLARMSRIDLATALLGTLPGGAPGMVALSDALGADTRLVALMQTLRVMLVVVSLAIVTAVVWPASATDAATTAHLLPATSAPEPLGVQYALTAGITVIGAWVGRRLRLPAGVLVGPALLGAVAGLLGVPQAEWPSLILVLAYAVVGVVVGLQFDVPAMRMAGRLMLPFLVNTIVLIGGAALLGLMLALLTAVDPFSAYLATTPGGLSVVVILALEGGANITLVLTMNLLRFLMIILAGPPLVRRVVRRFAERNTADRDVEATALRSDVQRRSGTD